MSFSWDKVRPYSGIQANLMPKCIKRRFFGVNSGAFGIKLESEIYKISIIHDSLYSGRGNRKFLLLVQ